ncbi:hypothetical protein HS99_0002185 [Kitasatospora aureofaciens]|uniref:Uncharacterized protein n=1 Tax=Kitasatospora aureofaciens TaxID=1894 RepID=A0A1E7NFN6_KITAU|nr:hypothetical protein HS99_0002185 [Kitasatospora aureofaciens]
MPRVAAVPMSMWLSSDVWWSVWWTATTPSTPRHRRSMMGTRLLRSTVPVRVTTQVAPSGTDAL